MDNASNRSLGRVGKPIGTHVISRSSGVSSSGTSSLPSSRSTGTHEPNFTNISQSSGVYVDNAYNRRVGRAGQPLGSQVISRSSDGASSGSNSCSTVFNTADGNQAYGVYVDNAYNRRVGRAGQPLGSQVISGSSDGATSSSNSSSTVFNTADGSQAYGVYVDNAYNRRVGRAGQPLGSHVISHSSDTVSSGFLPSSRSASTYAYNFSDNSQAYGVYADNAYNRSVGRVGQPLGSHVINRISEASNGFSPSGRSSTLFNSTDSSQAYGMYADNAYNRSVGRVGQPLGSHVVSHNSEASNGASPSGRSNTVFNSTDSSQACGVYTDNAYNRSVGRVGQPLGSNVISRSSGALSASNVGNSSSSSFSSSSVSGDTGANGAPYTRLVLQGHSSSGYACDVSRYVTAYVAPYAMSTPQSNSSSRSTRDVNGFMRSDGAYEVDTRARSTAGTSAASEPCMSSVPTIEAASRVYVDNAYNRKLGRVGKPIGTHVVSRITGLADYYSDNPVNRRLDCVGKPITKGGYRPKKIMENYTITEVKFILEGLEMSDEPWQDYQCTHGYLQQLEVEESWGWSGIQLSTNIPFLDYCAGQKLIPYKELVLKEEIGRGSFGVVMAGLWHNTAIAFKRLHNSRMSKKQLDNFLREATILTSLDHPHTVKLFGAVAESSCVGFVMEYLRRSLYKAIFIDECEFTDDKKKATISQTADALVYLHDNKRIAHCDIKSESILLDSYNDVKLADFGLSTVKSVTETTQSVRAGQGTPRYSAPEVLRREQLSKSQLFPTDVYSLAIVVFEVFTEEEPFDGLNLNQLERQVGNEGLRPTSENNTPIDDSVKELLYECWDRVPPNRPKAKDFQEKWKHLMKSPSTHSKGLR